MSDLTDAHQAAYAKGLEDAAREIEPSNPRDDWTPYAHDMARAATRIRALSPLTPGSRVVVVPPEGSAAWEYAAGAAFAALPPDAYGTIGAGEMYRVIRAALRALTGGEP